MNPLNLHIICFDVPYPANYGGAIEEFYKLKTLAELGVKIQLHCFVYDDRKQANELEQYCEKVYYYPRKKNILAVFSTLPFIVKTRLHKALLENLLKDNFPILMDGIHTTGFINYPSLKNRKIIVRMHNIEWIYYSVLFHSAYSLKEKLFYFLEYKKLRKYEKTLVNATLLSCLSKTDFEYYNDKFPNKCSLEYIFHEDEKLQNKIGTGNYIIFHGNLSLVENYQSIIQFISSNLKNCNHSIILAGKNPHKNLNDFVRNNSNLKLIENPSNYELNQLIQDAQICICLSGNPTGIKLKLIHSLYQGRFIFCNENTLNGSQLDDLVIDIDTCTSLSETIDFYMLQPFTQEHINKRKIILEKNYNNINNAKQLINTIFTT